MCVRDKDKNTYLQVHILTLVFAMKAHPTMADKMVARTFWEVDHGWAAARGDWNNPRIRAGV